ncbi:MAG: zf-TFIIB domain-containing protein [Anaerolineae bacterium]|nr:zf-TFIIB domain-containing protein [Anaerolineae bacterium]
MKCPTCDVKLIYDKRKGIDIEQCPDCNGVWLNPLEFERLVHKKSQTAGNVPKKPNQNQKKNLFCDTF